MYILRSFNAPLIAIALFIFYFTAITVMFSQTCYRINEDDGSAQIGLLLISNLSSADITVQVTNTDGSATGEYCSTLIS